MGELKRESQIAKSLAPQIGPQTLFAESSADIVIYGGAAGGGKALPLDAQIPTPHGWVSMGDIRLGSDVFDESGSLCKVTRLFDVDSMPELYRLRFDDQSEIDCCRDHQWLTFSAAELAALTRRDPSFRARRRAARPSRTTGRRSSLFTQAITRRNVERPPESHSAPTGTVRTTAEIVATLRTNRGRLNHAIPVAGCLDLPDAFLPLDPYLLGAWLGDGTASNSTFTSVDSEIWEAFEKQGFCVTHRKDGRHHTILGLSRDLRAVGVFNNKHIPQIYLRSSRRQRLALLRGLMDTDGTVARNSGSPEFSNTNERIIDGAVELICSLGWKVNKRAGRACLNGRDCGPKWTLKWLPDENVFALPRKRDLQKLSTRRVTKFRYIKSADRIQSRPARCISVNSKSRLYLAGRQMVPTHNSYGLLLEALRHTPKISGFYAVFFRRHMTEIVNPGGLWDESLNIFSLVGGTPIVGLHEWRWPNHSKVRFAHLQLESDVLSWHGAQVPFLAFDELTQFSFHQFWYLISRNRSTCGVKPYIRATCNPDAESWVADFISWWIDQDTGFAINERAGVIRYVVRGRDDNLLWGDTADEVRPYLAIPKDWPAEFEPPQPKSVTFIPARLSDNPALMGKDPNYLANLLAQPLVVREQLLGGNWKIRPAAGLYFRRGWCEVVDAAPARLKQVRYWDLASTEKTKNNDPDWTVGIKLGRDDDGMIYVLDVTREQVGPFEVERLIKNTASTDKRNTVIGFGLDPGQAGKSQAAYLVRSLMGYTVRPAPETGGKITRFGPFSSQCKAGNVKILSGPWNDAFFRTLEGFPELSHDDDVDAASGALELLGFQPSWIITDEMLDRARVPMRRHG